MKMYSKTGHLFKNSLNVYNVLSTRHSALFISGAKATENFIYVNPHIDFTDLLENKKSIAEYIIKRKSNIDFEKIINLWNVYDELIQKKEALNRKREEISKELGQIIKNDPDCDEAKKLKMQINLIKDNIKKFKAPLWSAEEAATVEALKLPNKVHAKTPNENCTVLHSHLTQPSRKKHHLNIAQNLDLVYFKNNENYYFKNRAALFELGAKFYFSNILKKSGFIQFSNADFVKSLVVEGCGKDHTDADATFILHHNENTAVNVDNRMHLAGGGSLFSFMAYFVKNVIPAKVLPFKYFTMGRQYIPCPSTERSLLHVSQSSVLELFGAAKDPEELDAVLQELTTILITAYSSLGYHFRVTLKPADQLMMWESLRISVEMFSTYLQTYVEVGNISLSGDFISKRLMFTYLDNKLHKFPHIISGTILNVPKFLAIVLEQESDFTLPDLFSVKNWT